jgi:hypothetical protein
MRDPVQTGIILPGCWSTTRDQVDVMYVWNMRGKGASIIGRTALAPTAVVHLLLLLGQTKAWRGDCFPMSLPNFIPYRNLYLAPYLVFLPETFPLPKHTDRGTLQKAYI